MRRSRIVALTLVVAMIMMGTAYAAWTQTVSVATTVETGELKVTIGALGRNAQNLSPWVDSEIGQDFTPDLNIETQGQGDGEYVKITGSNFYPGTSATVRVDLKNDGSIPADITMKDMVDNLPENATLAFNGCVWMVDGVRGESLGLPSNNTEFDSVEDLATAFGEITLEPGEVIRVGLMLRFDDDQNQTMEESRVDATAYEFAFDFDVTQFNID